MKTCTSAHLEEINLDIFEVIADLNFGEDEVELPVLVCLLVRVEGAGRHQELHQLALLAHAELAALGLGVQPLGLSTQYSTVQHSTVQPLSLPTRHSGEGGKHGSRSSKSNVCIVFS